MPMPDLQVKQCTCKDCSRPTLPGHDPKLMHWYCCMCGRGPVPFIPQGPHFTKMWIQPGGVQQPNGMMSHGGVRGIAHYCCGPQCMNQYLAMLGVTVGMNEHIGVPQGDSLPVVHGGPQALTSD